MTSIIKHQSFQTTLLTLIIVLIGFQQFPIIRVGGSLKVYEILAITLLATQLFSMRYIKLTGFTIIVGCFFVVSPLLSYLNSIIFLDYPSGFYLRFLDTTSFKYQYYIFPVLQLVYMFFNFSVIYTLYTSTELYQKLNTVIRISIILATIISIYSLTAMFSVDVVRLLPSFIQNKSEFLEKRSYGLSQEPSFYVLYQGWICLLIYFSKKLFAKTTWYFIFLINVLSFVLCFSTMIVGFLAAIFINGMLFGKAKKQKLILITSFVMLFIIGYIVIDYFNLYDIFNYYIVTKITSFSSVNDHTLDSGSYRNYTSAIGIEIFKDHPLFGVGVGNSIYYMYLHEFKMGISSFGEMITADSFPQNCFSIVLSEQGLFGACAFFCFLFSVAYKLWKDRNRSKYSQMFFIGAIFNFLAMLSIAPVYSLFIWLFMALGLGYNRFLKKTQEATLC